MTAVIINCFETYEERVELLKRALIKEGYEVCIYASDYLHSVKKERRSPGMEYILFHAYPYKSNLSFRRLLSHYSLARNIFSFLNKNPEPQLIWLLLPPNSCAREAAAYKKNHPGVKLVFDIIDLWPEGMPVEIFKYLPMGNIWRSLRNKNLPFADCIVIECDRYRSFLGKLKNKPGIKTVYMSRPLEKLDLTFVPPKEGNVALCYLGSINHLIDIKYICKVIRNFKKKTDVELHVIGDGENRATFLKKAQKAGALVKYHGLIYDREEKRKIMNACHYGLNIMKKNICVGFTMKSIDYYEFGLPNINNLDGDTRWINEKYKTGVNICDGIMDFDNYSCEMRENARRFFCDYLTEERFDKKIHEIITGIS